MIERLGREARRARRAAQIIGHVAVGLLVADTVLALLARYPGENVRRWRARLVQWWCRRVCRSLNVAVAIHGEINTAPTLYVANHVSWLDIPCLGAVLSATFVSKDDVLRWPAIGRMAWRAGTIFIRRGQHRAATLAAEQMTWLLTQRRSVIVFPEGTTTDGRWVRPFHARLYQAAIRTNTPVQAVAIHYPGGDSTAPFVGDDDLVRHLWGLLRERGIPITLTFCPPIAADGTRRALAQMTRTQVQAALGMRFDRAVNS